MGVLNDAIYCHKNIKIEGQEAIGEEYRVVVSRILAKINEIKQKNQEENYEKDMILKKTLEEVKDKTEENFILKKEIADSQKKLSQKWHHEIAKLLNQVRIDILRN